MSVGTRHNTLSRSAAAGRTEEEEEEEEEEEGYSKLTRRRTRRRRRRRRRKVYSRLTQWRRTPRPRYPGVEDEFRRATFLGETHPVTHPYPSWL